MKKVISILITNLLVIFALGQESVRVLKSDMNQLVLKYHVDSISIMTTIYDSIVYNTLNIEGYGNSSAIGKPMLPVSTNIIEIPICKNLKYDILDARYDTIDLNLKYVLQPAQTSRSKSDTCKHPLEIDTLVYQQNNYFLLPLVKVEPIGIARDKNLATLSFSPIQYNPQTGKIVVCSTAVVKISYQGTDEKATIDLKKYSTPSFTIGHEILNELNISSRVQQSSLPVRMVVVAHPMFRGIMNDFVAWKRRKGFIVDVAYLDQPEVGFTTDSIKMYLRNLYNNASDEAPAPTYVVLVGDVEQLPACHDKYPAGYWGEEHHPTDLYYAEWTNDMLPDAYYGRYSAQDTSQLIPQLRKTLMYEQYTFADPSFLDRAVLVAGEDNPHGRKHADPTVSQLAKLYFNGNQGFSQVKCFQNNTLINDGGRNVIVKNNKNKVLVDSAYNEGAGWINYTAHGNIYEWTLPKFTVRDVKQMKNIEKFGVIVGNCCYSNKFEYPECFGESLMRQGNYTGAVNYIGASNYTYWDEDVYWSIGVRSNIDADMPLKYDKNCLGMYDKLFHLHGEPYEKWVTCVGGITYSGNMSVQSSESLLKNYYWEVYHVLGDPSIAPWLTQSIGNIMVVGSPIYAGSTSAKMYTMPYAYVAITKDSVVIAATYADRYGVVNLNFNSIEFGNYELAVSLMGYNTTFIPISVLNVGVDKVLDASVKIYPNPTSSILHVEGNEIRNVAITNIEGVEVLNETVLGDIAQINIGTLLNGIYFIKVKTLDGIFVTKIIKI